MSELLFGGIEAGGTKMICAVGDSSGKISRRVMIPTTTPEETMPRIFDYFQTIQKEMKLAALGISCFGPIDPNPQSLNYGFITTTPKLPWANFDIVGKTQKALGLPIGFDTDVNGAALSEYRWGAAQGLRTFIYLTIGTGIGGGAMVEGKLLHGLTHPEMGHIFVPHDKRKDPFEGVCPYHKNCLEGLASGPAIQKRWRVKSALDLPPDHEAWDLEANYLAYAAANYTMTLSPQKIIFGGGVMKQQQLFPKIRKKLVIHLAGYINQSLILEKTDQYMVPPGLGQNSGICGAIALAEKAYQE